MTALSAYDVLEAPGRWHPATHAPARDVIVSFGKSSLVLTTVEETPLSHWALRGIRRAASGAHGVTFEVEGSAERLVLNDPAMIEAIETVSRAVKRKEATRAPWRWMLGAGAVLALVLIAFLYVPPYLRGLVVEMMPPEKKALLSRDILKKSPGICTNPAGQEILNRFSGQLLGPGGGRVYVARNWATPVSVLPDGTLILDEQLVIGATSGPSSVAGWMLAGDLAAQDDDLLTAWADQAPLSAIVTFLLNGTLDTVQVEEMALLNQKGRPLPLGARQVGAVRLTDLNLSPARFWAQAGAGLPLPTKMVAGARPALGDQDWVALLGICAQRGRLGGAPAQDG